MQSQVQSQKQVQKPFCKVCFDAGKTIAEYSTHYVRDQPGGVVTCPTILKQQCRYCKKNGHTPKHCPELEGKYKPDGMRKPEVKPEVKPEEKRFKPLTELSDNFPLIGGKDGGKIIRPTPVKLNVWASVVANGPVKAAQAPVAQAPAQAEAEEAQAPAEAQAEEEAQAPAEQEYRPQDYSKGSWADY